MAFSITSSLGQLIREARERKGMARTKLAKFAGISPNSMVKYEKAGQKDGKYPSMKNMAKICHLLKIDPRRAFEMLIQSGEVEVERTFHFTYFFKDRDDDWNLENITSRLDMSEHVADINSVRLERIESGIADLISKMGSGSNAADPSRQSGLESAENEEPGGVASPPGLKQISDD